MYTSSAYWAGSGRQVRRRALAQSPGRDELFSSGAIDSRLVSPSTHPQGRVRVVVQGSSPGNNGFRFRGNDDGQSAYWIHVIPAKAGIHLPYV